MLVVGATTQIDQYLNLRGFEPNYVGGYRVTDGPAMLAAMEAAGTSRVEVEAELSKVILSCISGGATAKCSGLGGFAYLGVLLVCCFTDHVCTIRPLLSVLHYVLRIWIEFHCWSFRIRRVFGMFYDSWVLNRL